MYRRAVISDFDWTVTSYAHEGAVVHVARVCVCMCACVCAYTCMYICVCMYVCMYVCTYVYVYACMYVCLVRSIHTSLSLVAGTPTLMLHEVRVMRGLMDGSRICLVLCWR